ncbi:MAG: alpha-mannosidase, partial [Promethearchaeota archaeon]
FERIKKNVKDGSFNIVGGCWVEPDCMMPSGEAMVRQRIYGMYFFKEKFGVMPEIAWMLDSFGYGRNLPQIFKKSGAKYFWTTKITWNKCTVFPFVNFYWQSPDGSRVLCHECQLGDGTLKNFWLYEIGRHPLKPGMTYVGDYTRNYEDIADFVEDEEFCKTIGVWYGKGDGGHGPTSQEVAEAMEMQALGMGHVGTAMEYFSKIDDYSKEHELPVWNDELYLEYHRGTFTTHSRVKRNNRWLECKSISVEMLCSLLSVMFPDRFDYPKEVLDENWKTILKNQFHDALPGSSIPEAYDDLYEDWEYCNEWLDDCISKVVKKLGFNKENEILIFNPNAGMKCRVFIPADLVPGVDLDDNGCPPRAAIKLALNGGELYPLQPVAAELDDWLECKPAGWWTVLPLEAQALNPAEIILDDDKSISELFIKNVDVSIEGNRFYLENGLLRVELDPKTGAILKAVSSLVPAVDNIFSGPSNIPMAFVDDFPSDQAWNIRNTRQPEYNDLKRPYKLDEDVHFAVTKNGPIVSEISISKKFGPQEITQRIALFKDMPEIYCEFITDWNEPVSLVKIAFQTATNAEFVESDSQYCIVKRRTKPDTPADKARWEKIQHKFSDMHAVDGSWGIAFLNDGKYAFDTLDPSTFRLTVLKSANYPSPAGESWVHQERKMNLDKYGKKPPQFTDLGPHRTRYAIYPHAGITRQDQKGNPTTDVKRRADAFNFPLLLLPASKGSVGDLSGQASKDLPVNAPLISSSNESVLIKSIKMAERIQNTLVLRLVEYAGVDTRTTISLHPKLAELIEDIQESDLLERPLNSKTVWHEQSRSFDVDMGKCEIKTFLLKVKG